MQMSFIEFLEGFARVAEKLSPLKLKDNPLKIDEFGRIQQYLDVKMTNLIQLMSQLKQ